ncbi:hypothetical protein PFTANZ_05650, partial [Plasmodium falciparum Tanzania (2000708)]
MKRGRRKVDGDGNCPSNGMASSQRNDNSNKNIVRKIYVIEDDSTDSEDKKICKNRRLDLHNSSSRESKDMKLSEEPRHINEKCINDNNKINNNNPEKDIIDLSDSSNDMKHKNNNNNNKSHTKNNIFFQTNNPDTSYKIKKDSTTKQENTSSSLHDVSINDNHNEVNNENVLVGGNDSINNGNYINKKTNNLQNVKNTTNSKRKKYNSNNTMPTKKYNNTHQDNNITENREKENTSSIYDNTCNKNNTVHISRGKKNKSSISIHPMRLRNSTVSNCKKENSQGDEEKENENNIPNKRQTRNIGKINVHIEKEERGNQENIQQNDSVINNNIIENKTDDKKPNIANKKSIQKRTNKRMNVETFDICAEQNGNSKKNNSTLVNTNPNDLYDDINVKTDCDWKKYYLSNVISFLNCKYVDLNNYLLSMKYKSVKNIDILDYIHTKYYDNLKYIYFDLHLEKNSSKISSGDLYVILNPILNVTYYSKMIDYCMSCIPSNCRRRITRKRFFNSNATLTDNSNINSIRTDNWYTTHYRNIHESEIFDYQWSIPTEPKGSFYRTVNAYRINRYFMYRNTLVARTINLNATNNVSVFYTINKISYEYNIKISFDNFWNIADPENNYVYYYYFDFDTNQYYTYKITKIGRSGNSNLIKEFLIKMKPTFWCLQDIIIYSSLIFHSTYMRYEKMIHFVTFHDYLQLFVQEHLKQFLELFDALQEPIPKKFLRKIKIYRRLEFSLIFTLCETRKKLHAYSSITRRIDSFLSDYAFFSESQKFRFIYHFYSVRLLGVSPSDLYMKTNKFLSMYDAYVRKNERNADRIPIMFNKFGILLEALIYKCIQYDIINTDIRNNKNEAKNTQNVGNDGNAANFVKSGNVKNAANFVKSGN